MANEKRLIDANALFADNWFPSGGYATDTYWQGYGDALDRVEEYVQQAPTVDAVELPKGKPGDYLEWDNGAGFKQIYHIHGILICDDCMRYDIEICTPVVDHPNIVRILSLEEAEKEWKEMCAKAMPREEPTLTAGERK